jgi:hypothetical protein
VLNQSCASGPLQNVFQQPARSSKPRKPSIRTLVTQAEKATGKAVTAITMPDGAKLDFTKAEQQGNEVDQWIAKHADKTQRH